MARFLVLVLFAGCASRAVAGPAWPKERVTDEDGGESIAPRADQVAATSSPDDAPADASAKADTTDSDSNDTAASTSEASDDSSDDDASASDDDDGDDASSTDEIVIDVDP